MAAFRAYSLYKDGFLPEPGGMNDQAALFPEIMLILKSAHAYVDNYEEERQRNAQQTAIPIGGKR